MTIVLYCQHVLGLGHFMRSLELARALAGHRVVFVSGGPEVDAPLPAHVVLQRLPALAMDEEFNALYAPAGDLEAVKAARRAQLMEVMERHRPDCLLVELYPFGRRAFEFELVPVLAAARQGRFGSVRVVCSLRDVLVEKKDPEKYQARVLERLNTFFDALLVHADPAVVRLEETFPRAKDIVIPVVHTGFVAAAPAAGARRRLRGALGLSDADRLVVASAGGGKVGGELLDAAVKAFRLLDARLSTKLHIFTGPFLDDGAYARLVSQASGSAGVDVSRFAPDFPDWLAACDLSLSLAGYNTAMNLLAAGARALVWPFGQNREQQLRALRLEALGALHVLGPADIEPSALAWRMDLALRAGPPPPAPVRLDGATVTAGLFDVGSLFSA